MSRLADALRKAWKNPEEWTLDEYRATHKSGICLWIANGAWFFDFDSVDAHIGLLERHWLWREFNWAMKQSKRRARDVAVDWVINRLEAGESS